ncbi:E1 protein [Papillomaviridae sp. Haddock_c6033]|nr:E1 protein [Papillomaviridae sp. Haddock_c6033]
MAEFLDLEAECVDPHYADLEGEEMATQLFCTCVDKENCTCDMFIDDNSVDDNTTPTKTPWEVTLLLEQQAEDEMNNLFDCTPPETSEKRVRDITDSVEKLHVCPLRSPPKKVMRNLNTELLHAGEVVEGTYVYNNLTEEETEQVETILEESETLLETELNAEDVSEALTKEADEGSLRSYFFQWATCKTAADEAQGKTKGARWYDVARTMKSEKTMQKNWMVFCERPRTGLRRGPFRSHVAIEALLCQDADGIRAKHSKTHCMYILEYRTKSRSVTGLKKLLKQGGVNCSLIGVPFQKKPLVRDWISCYSTPLIDKPERDLEWLQERCGVATGFKFNPEEMIQFCEESEPHSVEILIANYRAEAEKGSENAQAWIELTSAYNHAQQCFKMWKATAKGKQMQMSLLTYINFRLGQIAEGQSKNVKRLLLFQGINELTFMNTMRKWLRGNSKQNVLCLVGPGNSGKSMLAEAIILCLDGAVLSINEHNQFWKQGMISKRFCLLDDVTLVQWNYLDNNERRALDGGIISVNKKFSDPVETRMPPTLITTNYFLPNQGNQFDFLVNRLTWITFAKELPKREDGLSRISVKPEDIATWFQENKDSLDLE